MLTIKGVSGKAITVDGGKVIITKKGMLTAKREKVIPISNISGVEVKKPGMVNGFIQIQIAGQKSGDSSFTFTGGAFDAASDENSVLFSSKSDYSVALKMQEHILSYNDRPSQQPAATSAADEIVKFKGLLDQGIITQEEFDSKKKQLLGI